MRTADPTAGPAHAARELRERFLNPDASCLRFFPRYDPTNPFVPCERRNILPHFFRPSVGNKSLPQVRWHCMWHTVFILSDFKEHFLSVARPRAGKTFALISLSDVG